MSPDYQPVPEVPEGHVAGQSNTIWTPTNVEYLQSWIVGYTGNGLRVWKHEFKLTYRGEQEMFGVMGPDGTPDSQIEDLAAGVAERAATTILEKLQARGNRLRPEDLAEREHWDVRRDLAGAMREFRRWAKKRRASTNQRTLYKGLT